MVRMGRSRIIATANELRTSVQATLALVAAVIGSLAAASLPAASASPNGIVSHGIAMHGEPALPPTFSHLPYVNPNAPKGGKLTYGQLGTFDSLNPLIVRGIAVQQVRGHVIESLLARSHDEPFALYGLLAESIETDDARTYATFRINPKATFSDGRPVTADDVLFSRDLLQAHGRPNHRLFYAKVAHAEALDARTVRFDFGGQADRELPLILGLMPVLPKHAIDPETFEETSMTAPVGSGPYRVTDVRPGANVTMTRNPDYWGRDLPINRGLWNFDEIRIEYFRDGNTAFEAFKRGLYDFRFENEPLRWSSGYDIPAAQDGRLRRDTTTIRTPQPAEYLVFNTRRPHFADVRVRQALGLLFDFDWINQNYFFNLYARSASFFPGSELSAYGNPAMPDEKRLLTSLGAAVRTDILDGSFRLQGGRDRAVLRQALDLLSEAGYRLSGNVLREEASGNPFVFEMLTTTRDQERIALTFARDLKRIGVEAKVRVVDSVQFDQRRLSYDFDMIQNRWDQSLSPGNEQSFYFGSAAAEQPGTRNYMGARNPAIDGAIAAMLETREQPAFVTAVRALDRLLMSGFYAIPVYNVPAQWLAHWSSIKRPMQTSLTGQHPETWWRGGENAAPATPNSGR